tara:strand:- start:161 stop:388 length:228 start_codon:yes stop_codon:yes gene_type:complete
MRYFLALVLCCTFSGCAFFEEQEDPATVQYNNKKEALEREIELLRLERRKILLQNSLDGLDSVIPEGLKQSESNS